MWFYLICLAGIIFTVRTILARKILKEESDTLAYTLVGQAITAILILPVSFFDWQMPANKALFFFLFLIGVWDALSSFLITESLRLLEVSWRTIIYQSRTILLIFLGYLFLGEVLNWQKIGGGILVFLGVVLATFKKRRLSRLWSLWGRLRNGQKTEREKGFLATIAAVFSTAFELMAMKYLLDFFTPAMMILGLAGSSALVFSLIVQNKRERILRLPRLTFYNASLGPVGAYLFFRATAMAEVSRTVPISNAFTILTVILGIVFLKERERIWQKILGTLLAMAGVVLIKTS